mmetsp:Transcript_107606/g.304206  ORF Transcript_107606/g.304206 Transcript_107606/m.304206 type:complete len:365 (+) Transcript_107606:345-1439(+)
MPQRPALARELQLPQPAVRDGRLPREGHGLRRARAAVRPAAQRHDQRQRVDGAPGHEAGRLREVRGGAAQAVHRAAREVPQAVPAHRGRPQVRPHQPAGHRGHGELPVRGQPERQRARLQAGRPGGPHDLREVGAAAHAPRHRHGAGPRGVPDAVGRQGAGGGPEDAGAQARHRRQRRLLHELCEGDDGHQEEGAADEAARDDRRRRRRGAEDLQAHPLQAPETGQHRGLQARRGPRQGEQQAQRGRRQGPERAGQPQVDVHPQRREARHDPQRVLHGRGEEARRSGEGPRPGVGGGAAQHRALPLRGTGAAARHRHRGQAYEAAVADPADLSQSQRLLGGAAGPAAAAAPAPHGVDRAVPVLR